MCSSKSKSKRNKNGIQFERESNRRLNLMWAHDAKPMKSVKKPTGTKIKWWAKQNIIISTKNDTTIAHCLKRIRNEGRPVLDEKSSNPRYRRMPQVRWFSFHTIYSIWYTMMKTNKKKLLLFYSFLFLFAAFFSPSSYTVCHSSIPFHLWFLFMQWQQPIQWIERNLRWSKENSEKKKMCVCKIEERRRRRVGGRR